MKPCPNCGYCPPRPPRKRPETYANNCTQIEIQLGSEWRSFPSVKQAERETGIHRWHIFQALRGGPNQKLLARLARIR